VDDVAAAVELLEKLAEHAIGDETLSEDLRLARGALEQAGAAPDAASLLLLLVT
jgi:Flp pilus assembly protein TadD